MRLLTPLALVALMSLAPVAAQETKEGCPEGTVESPEGCSRPAWVEDCPPDMMCAASHQDADPDAPAEDCGADVCAFGPDDCIDCMTPPSTCMDGADAGEACDDDVQYLDGGAGGDGGANPVRGPADGSCEFCRGEEAGIASVHASPAGIAAAGLLVVLALLVAVVRRA